MAHLKDLFALIVGLLALIGFSSFVVFLLDRLTTTDLEWTRAIYLFNGVEAIAFAAAGYFFGREVHRERAERAEETVDTARQGEREATLQATAAEKQKVDAESKAVSLVSMIEAKAAGQEERAQQFMALDSRQVADVARADLRELQKVAQRLFPGS